MGRLVVFGGVGEVLHVERGEWRAACGDPSVTDWTATTALVCRCGKLALGDGGGLQLRVTGLAASHASSMARFRGPCGGVWSTGSACLWCSRRWAEAVVPSDVRP